MRCRQVISIMEELAPKELAESWDNVGLQIGNFDDDVKKILVTLDVTDQVVDEAIEGNIDMIIAHHPLIFKSLSSIRMDDSKGRIINKLVKNDINLYVSHTNMDIAHGGLNDMLAKKLKLENIKVLFPSIFEKLYKISVFVPEGYEDQVREVLGDAQAGWIGNYSHCTFQSKGIGTFKPLEGADPFIGNVNDSEKVDEYRIETIVSQKNLSNAINEMIKVHPYEEVAYDVYPLEIRGAESGLGRVGDLEKSMGFKDFIGLVKEVLNIDTVKLAGRKKDNIKKVGLCTGSGGDLIGDAAKEGVDVYITGDVKYHEAQLAEELGILLIDGGHYSTEIIFMEGVKDYLDRHIGDELKVIESKLNQDVFNFQ